MFLFNCIVFCIFCGPSLSPWQEFAEYTHRLFWGISSAWEWFDNVPTPLFSQIFIFLPNQLCLNQSSAAAKFNNRAHCQIWRSNVNNDIYTFWYWNIYQLGFYNNSFQRSSNFGNRKWKFWRFGDRNVVMKKVEAPPPSCWSKICSQFSYAAVCFMPKIVGHQTTPAGCAKIYVLGWKSIFTAV